MAWARPGTPAEDIDDVRRDLEAIQAPEDEIRKQINQLKGKPASVYPEHWEALQIFSRLGNQWEHSYQGTRTGLKYPAIESTLNLLGIRYVVRRRELFEQIQLLETGALRQWASKSNR